MASVGLWEGASMLTRRERERAEENRAALDKVRQSIAPHLRAAGFRKASINTWRLDLAEIAVRLQLELGSRPSGPWAAVGGELQAIVAASPTPATPFRECIFDSQLELARRETAYQVSSEADRSDFLDDLIEHSLPWLLKYERFDDVWRALLHAELPSAMIPARPARPKQHAREALEVAFNHQLGPAYIDEAVAYSWDRGFAFDPSSFGSDMSEIVVRLPLSGDRRP